ncbi:MAG: hypothetical protein KF767_06325 [Bdellovibrionaceae bacterium]|nr:hypothetical protein [Pseudobdellovibrionaceae bacterium]
MKSLILILLTVFFSMQAFASGGRMTTAQVRATVQDARERLKNQNDPQARKAELERLQTRLQQEFNKGSASFDATFVYVNKVLLDLENILYNDCKKSRDLIVNQTLGADPNLRQRDAIQREMSEGLALHTSYCSGR